MVDPYESWLGIAKDQRPVTYYLLLGVSPKEADAKTIEKAAARRLDKLTPHAEGPNAAACTRIRKELEKAKAILLDPAKRKEYDAILRKRTSGEESDDEEKTAKSNGEPERKESKPGKEKKGKKKKQQEDSSKATLWIALVGSAALLLVAGGVGAYLMFGSSGSKRPDPSQIASTKDKGTANAKTGMPATPSELAKQKENEKAKEKAVAEKSPPAQKEAPKAAPMPKANPTPPPPPPPPPPVVIPVPKLSAPIARLTVPDDASQATAEKALKETYKADYAKTTPDDKLALSAKLLQPGREDRKNPAAWFALLREARDLAVQAERPRLAVEAIGDMHKHFNVDGHDLKIRALTAVSQSRNEANLKSLMHVAAAQVNAALDDDRYDAALSFLAIADAAGKKAKADKDRNDKKKLDSIEARKAEVEKAQKDFTSIAQARQKLVGNPADPEANLVAGRHACFFQGRWPDGLPLLAKGSDPKLADLAKHDLALSPDPKEETAVGDGWMALSKEFKDPRREQNLMRRALYWYELAEERFPDGAERDAVYKRIGEVVAKEGLRPTRLAPGSFQGRTLENRTILLREGGGTMRSEEAIQRGLDWLAAHQFPGREIGGWGMDSFSITGRCNCGDPGQKFDVGATALALMPFLGAGEAPGRGRFKEKQTVLRGLRYLLAQQKEKKEGQFSDHAYENALATIVICEAYALNRQPAFRDSAQAAINYIVNAQNSEGGWSYTPRAKGADTSVSGWQFSALKAGTYAGLLVPPITFDRLASFLNSVADPSGLGYGYNKPIAGRSTTAAGLLVREFMGWGPGHPLLNKGVNHLLLPQNMPTKEATDLYYTFYASQVMHHRGGRAWEKWNVKVRDMLIDLQDKGTEPGLAHQKGSWSPKSDAYKEQGGRMMVTALALINLETYYYHVPLFDYGSAVLDE